MKKAVILLADGFEEVEAVTPIDFLRRAGVDVTLVGVSGPVAEGSRGISVETDLTVEEYSDSPDMVIIPGGKAGAAHVAASAAARDIIRQAYNNSALVAALCAAPALVLGPMGLLDGRKYTCYPGFEKEMTEGIFLEDRVVVDGTLITSRGPGTAAEFSLTLIEKMVGKKESEAIQRGTLQPF